MSVLYLLQATCRYIRYEIGILDLVTISVKASAFLWNKFIFIWLNHRVMVGCCCQIDQLASANRGKSKLRLGLAANLNAKSSMLTGAA
jgi:hypothetical protein